MSPLRDPDQTAYLLSLNPPQREAALATDGPLIVLAGAGSGKTKMLTSRMAWLMEGCGVPPYQILAVTFTNKAAGEMRERVHRFLEGSPAYGTPEIGTFHSICGRLLRREAQALPYTKPYVIYDDSDQLVLVKAAMERLGIDDKAFSPKSIQGAINRAKCDAIEPKDIEVAPHDLYQKQVKRVYEAYQQELVQNNAIDFGEMICLAYRVLRDHPEIRAKYQRLWRYILVDEYQDTNRAQYLFLRMLASREQGGHDNLCVVGDEDQSIYGWRGADIRNILEFERDYPGARVVKLEQNYRSTQTVVNAASRLISNNRTRKNKTLWTANPQGDPIQRYQVADERAEAEVVVSEIKRLAENDGRSFADFAIFYRTHAQSRQFEDVFRRERILYKIVGGLRFYDRKEIKDMLSYFRVLLNPEDSVSLKRILNVPARGIGKTTVEKIEARVQPLSSAGPAVGFGQALRLEAAAGHKKLAGFVALWDRLLEAAGRPISISELYHQILDETGYVAELKRENTEESLARVDNLEEFDNLLGEFEAAHAGALVGVAQQLPVFIEQSSLQTDLDARSDASGPTQAALLDAPSVSLMTLHSSKGLEFPVVFLPGMEEGLFPSTRPWEETDDEELEEERRLCYVGMTRARSRLYLLNAQARRLWGQLTYQEPSRFFAEIPDEFVESHDLTGAASGFARGGPRMIPSSFGSWNSSATQATTLRNGGRHLALVPNVTSAPASPAYGLGGGLTGQRIDHPDYGRGTILAAEGEGETAKVTIEFRGRDRRKFLYKYVRPYLEE